MALWRYTGIECMITMRLKVIRYGDKRTPYMRRESGRTNATRQYKHSHCTCAGACIIRTTVLKTEKKNAYQITFTRLPESMCVVCEISAREPYPNPTDENWIVIGLATWSQWCVFRQRWAQTILHIAEVRKTACNNLCTNNGMASLSIRLSIMYDAMPVNPGAPFYTQWSWYNVAVSASSATCLCTDTSI